ncbi:hypothetical protein QQF64_018149 [Cirrhinus molitorella]|uniref:Uncharacterized protein n=1 Tax=Cirrhinus molitorella TaxID=172907 RepID=A0ABR3LN09_9TELE
MLEPRKRPRGFGERERAAVRKSRCRAAAAAAAQGPKINHKTRNPWRQRTTREKSSARSLLYRDRGPEKAERERQSSSEEMSLSPPASWQIPEHA